MATDTAFAVALIAMMGRRVPVELRIFLTAAAIVDDIGAIVVVAFFYSHDLNLAYLAGAAVLTAMLALLNRAHVYRVTPYLMVGIALWVCVHGSGLHATLTGVLLALFIPTRPPPDLNALMTQANAIIAAEAQHGGEVLRHGPSTPALRALDAIHDRIESPADRMLRNVAPRSSYLVLPLFALANAGVMLDTRGVRRPRAADARDRLRAGDRQAARPGAGFARSPCASVLRSSRRSIRGASSLARARSPASDSRCRCSSPRRHLRMIPISPRRRSPCSPRRCCRLSSASLFFGMRSILRNES